MPTITASAVSGGVRPDWMFDVASACQHLVGWTFDASREEFARAMTAFADALPDPATPVEQSQLRDRLVVVATRAGQDFHRRFHEAVPKPECRRSPVEESGGVLLVGDRDPRILLHDWVAAYFRAFDDTHVWPAPVRAAAILERRFNQRINVRRVAREVACSKTGLERGFAKTFGMSMHGYQSRVRLRHAIPEIRKPDSNIDAVARSVGYKSSKNFYRVMDVLTGLVPSDIRRMSSLEIERLLETSLSLRPVRAMPSPADG